MRYREVIIDGRAYLQIVDDVEEPPPGWGEDPDDSVTEEKDDHGVWIGELVPYA